MRSGTGRRVRQLLLLCALALSVIGMHHVPLVSRCAPDLAMSAVVAPVAMVSIDQPAAQPSGDHCTGMVHDMLHLCLAVLWASALLLVLWLLVAGSADAATLTAKLRLPRWRVWRPPQTAGRSLLTSLCVLRT